MVINVKRVLATGTFDILHPGHIHYLTQAKKLGDELVVIVARDCMIKHKPKPIIPEKQRAMIISQMKMVDNVIVGSDKDIFEPLKSINPDIIALGYDQHFNPSKLKEELDERGFNPKIVRITKFEECDMCSSGDIIKRIIKISQHKKSR